MKVLIKVDLVDTPWGGGNQFLKALYKSLARKGIDVTTDPLPEDYDVVLLNSFNSGDVSRIDAWREKGIRIIHRIDGPTQLVRGVDRGEDRGLWELNKKCDHTIFQSEWSAKENKKLGWGEGPYSVIYNAVDGDIFEWQDKELPEHPLLVGSSWSNNPNKGLEFWRNLDVYLGVLPQPHPFSVAFVGRINYTFQNIKHIQPLKSDDLARFYKDCHIYIHPTRNEPCSNALIEAQACGLPAIYLDSNQFAFFSGGSNREVVGGGGIAIDNWTVGSFLKAYYQLEAQYDSIVQRIETKLIDTVTEKYLEVFNNG
jgi:glycosyltransferase involved in cell wall biosynthesis